MLPPDITHRQACVLRYMATFLDANDQLPTMQAMAAAFGWTSANTSFEYVARLEKKGYLQRNELGKHMIARTDQARQVIHAGGFMGANVPPTRAAIDAMRTYSSAVASAAASTAALAATGWPQPAATTP